MSKIIKSAKRVLALALAFALVLGYFPIDVFAEETTKTVYVGVVQWITDHVPTLHYWNNSGAEGDTALQPTGKTLYASVGGYWSGETQMFYLYTAQIPGDTTGVKTWDGSTNDRWAAEDAAYQENQVVLVFEYDGIYHNITQACHDTAHGTDSYCDVCGTYFGHTYDASGVCTGCGTSCAHESHDAEGNCAVCGVAVNHSFDAEGNCVCGISNNVPAVISDEIPCAHESHTAEGKCSACGEAVSHSYDAEGKCACGAVEEAPCAHESHDAEGKCAACGEAVSHSYDAEGKCACGAAEEAPCAHESHDAEGKCSACGEAVNHSFDAEGKCACGAVEEAPCAHESHDAEGKCSACGEAVNHSFDAEGKCVCGISNNVPAAISNEIPCAHENHDAEGKCSACGEDVGHSYDNGFCTTAEGEVHLQAAELNADGWYEISNAGQLYWFAQQVDNGTGADYNAVLTANITVNQGTMSAESTTARKWNPIGSYDAVYNGTFDGNGKTVSGLYLNDNSQEYVGLIAVVGEGATVKDVTLSNSYLYAKLRVGGIAAINSGTIEGCINNSRVEAKENNAGGIASNNNGTVKQCGNTGPVAGNMQTAGGVVSDNRSVVTECWNEGKVYSNSWGVSGGIVGYNVGEVTKCWNKGNIVTDGASSGGIVGCCPGTVRNCWNTGDISCRSGWDGGIVGLLQNGKVENCWSMGAVEILASGAGDGGDIVGSFEGVAIINNCYSTKRVIGEYMTEWDTSAMLTDVTEKPTAAFESGEITWLLNGKTSEGELVWGQNLVDGEGRQHVPTFDAPVVYEIQETCSGEVSYSNTLGNNVKHNYENGFCVNKKADGVTNCDAYEPAELLTAERCAELGLDAAYKGYYAIKNAGNLYWFAQQVDNGTGAGYNAVLIDDIKVNDGTMSAESTTARKWNPIGFANGQFDFSGAYLGTFDGNEKTISGLYFDDSTQATGQFVGMFAAVGSGAAVKNVTLSNSYLRGYAFIGGIVGLSQGTITGCVNTSDIVAGALKNYYGGIAGRNLGHIELCFNSADISGHFSSGGIAGENYSSGSINKCYNTGNISSSWSYAGGIAGSNTGTINNCGNTGNVFAYNTRCGGLVGEHTGAISNSYSTGTVTWRDQGNVIEGNTGGGAGVGFVYDNCNIINCYALINSDTSANKTANTLIGYQQSEFEYGLTEKSLAQFESGEVAYLLQNGQSEQVWGQNIDNMNTENGLVKENLPVFTDAKVYYVAKNCAGAMGYSNTDSPAPEHVYVNGFCDQVANETHYEPAEKLTAERCAELGLDATVYNGYYAITNGGNLYWFAQLVDNGPKDNNVVLLNDIEVNQQVIDASGALVGDPSSLRVWNPIGHALKNYFGTFDGRGCTISGLYYNDATNSGFNGPTTRIGLVSVLSGTVKNVTLADSYFNACDYAGAIAGKNGGTITGCVNTSTICANGCAGGIVGENVDTTSAGEYGVVELCGNSGKVTSTGAIAGGICGMNQSIIRNCWNSGEVKAGTNNAGGIVGKLEKDANDYNVVPGLENCWSTGAVSVGAGYDQCGGILGVGVAGTTVTNCYSIVEPIGSENAEDGTPTVTNVEWRAEDSFKDGEVAYLLRFNAAEGTNVWGQDLNNGKTVQTVPTFDGAVVYHVAKDCSGAMGYSNTDSPAPDHVYVNGFCDQVEGQTHYEPAIKVTAENWQDLGLDESYVKTKTYDFYYAIRNAGQLYWFAQWTNGGRQGYAQHVTSAVLLADIKVNDITVDGTTIYDSEGKVVENPNSLRAWTPIGTPYYFGTFDGNEHTISGLYYNSPAASWVGLIGRHCGEVQDLTVTNSYINANEKVGGIAGFTDGSDAGNQPYIINSSVTDSYIGGAREVGGITGYNSGTITGCRNTSRIVCTGYHAGGIAGFSDYTIHGHGIIERCSNEGDVSANNYAGGIAGSNACIIRNCWNTANAESVVKFAGGIVGYQGKSLYGDTVIENCWSTGTVTAGYDNDEDDTSGGIVGSVSGVSTISNCYSVDIPVAYENTNDGTPIVTYVQAKSNGAFNSGEVAFLLQTNAAEGTNVWGQDLDNGKTVQTVPTFDGAVVYHVAKDCSGVMGYSNTETAAPGHVYDANGFCDQVANETHYQPAVLNADGVYEISNAGQLYWFAQQVDVIPVTAENYGKLGLEEKYVGYYATRNADGSLTVFEKVDITAENCAALGLNETYIGCYATRDTDGKFTVFADGEGDRIGTYGSANAVLTADITINQKVLKEDGSLVDNASSLRAWNPIGWRWAEKNWAEYNGTFDGAGHTVSGMYFSNPNNAANVGLIAATGVDAVVKNITVTDSYLYAVERVGVIAGYNLGTITGCTNHAIITSGRYGHVGGIAGYNTGTVQMCVNTTDISAAGFGVGGIVGYGSGTVRNCWNTGDIYAAHFGAGGIVGDLEGNGKVQNCWSNCVTTSSIMERTGSIVGYIGHGHVQNCYTNASEEDALGYLGGAGNSAIVYSVSDEVFASGEVAYLLQNGQSEQVWGQNIDNMTAENGLVKENVPVFSNAVVYQNTLDCAGVNKGYSNTKTDAPEHVYVNGFCDQVEGQTHYEPAELLTPERCAELGLDATVYNGYYAITNGGNLYWFAELLDNKNNEYKKANAVLLNDIEVNQQVIDASGALVGDSSSLRRWNPIGNESANYKGTFDGRGYAISGLYFDDITTVRVALVSILGEEGVIKNVTLEDSYFNALSYVAAFAGTNLGTVTGCVNTSTMCANNYAGGIVGENSVSIFPGYYGVVELCGNRGKVASGQDIAGGISGYNKSMVRNCWNTGAITTGTHNAGGIVGLQKMPTNAAGIAARIENCWSTGAVTANGDCNTSDTSGGILGIGADGTVVSNCYSVALPIGDGNADSGTPTLTNVEWRAEDSFKDGEVAYLLRFNAAEGTNVWGQDLNNGKPVQTYPTFDGAPVYKITVNCSGVMGYSNTNSAAPDHVYDEKGFCDQVPDQTHYEPANRVTGETWQSLGLTVDHIGYYAIQKPGHLFWFAEKVNTSAPGFGTANAVLVNDITVNEPSSEELRNWFGIGFAGDSQGVSASVNPYCGTFDGNGFTVSGLNTEGNGYFTGLVNYLGEGGVVKNVTVSNSTMQNSETGLGAGAVVGWNRGTVTNCYNNSALSDNRYIGGIVGLNMGLVELCGNSGIITTKADTVMPFSRLRTVNNEDIVKAAGGIAARNAGIVRNCWNSATIAINNGNAGGMVGEQLTKVTVFDSYECSDVRLEYCWSNGVVTSGGKAGGIAGTVATDSFISTCYTNMETPVGSAKYDENNVITKTDEQFKSGEVTFLLQNPQAVQVWGQNIDNGGVNEGHPAFSPAVTYYHALNCAGVRVYTNIQDPNTDHSFVYKKMVDSTCTGTGTIEYWVCEICGRLFREENKNAIIDPEDIVTAPKGHLYGPEGACIRINDGKLCGHPAGASLTTKTCGTVFYDTLQQALDAAKTTVKADEALVKVLQDVTSTEISAVTAEGGVFTLDIGEFDLVGDDYGLSIENADVTITGTTGYIDCIYAQDSDLTISGATVSATKSDSIGINMHNSNLTVESGSVVNNKYSGYAIYGYGAGCTIDIQGGAISATGNTGKGIALSGGTTVSVSGGTIDAAEDIVVTDGLTDLTGILSGGTFPGGLAAKENGTAVSVNKLLSGGYSYWQQDKQVDVEDSAVSIQGDVQVNAVCKHPAITYSASGAVLSAHCDTCSAASVLELIPQTDADKIYSGTEKSVAYTGSILGVDTVPVVYEGDRVNVGTFKASVTVGDATVQMPMEILPYELEIKTFEPETKTYDGTTTCGIKSLTFVSTANGEELVLGTDFTAVLTFSSKNAGSYDDAVLTAQLLDTPLASNYVLKTDKVTSVSHTINPAVITVTDVKIQERHYDGTTDATVTDVTITGGVTGDDVKVLVDAVLEDKNSGENKTVNLTYTLSGEDAGNYVLAEETGTTTAKITVKPLPEIMEPVKDLTVDNATSDNKPALEDVKEELEHVLTDEGLTDEERKEREDALKEVQDMLDRIQEAADAIKTDPIIDTKHITAENVVPEDRDDILEALDDLYGALENYENNYTEKEKEGIHDDIERLEAALAALKAVEDVIKRIQDLPGEVEPDTPYRPDILITKDMYDDLPERLKDMIPDELVKKLNDLLDDLKDYRIIKGDGQTWSDGDLGFTANGPCDRFVQLLIDGNVVDASNYTVVSGSTVLTIKESYAETLTAGKHSISFVYPDGQAVGSFTVVIPTNGSAITGDDTPVMLLAVMMSVSLAGAVMLLHRKRKVEV